MSSKTDPYAHPKENARREAQAIDARLDRGEIDEDEWHREWQALVVPAYLAAETPWGQFQSGGAGSAGAGAGKTSGGAGSAGAGAAKKRGGAGSAGAAAGSEPPLRVLVAEDETIIRLDLRGLLEGAGFEVCAEARDGEEAVQLARETSPDVALLDVKMPRLDGIEAARRILDDRPIPIVMVTAYGERDVVSRAVEAGVFGYLVKPFRETDLLPAIETARVRHEELQALREEAESLAEALAARKAIERAKGILMEREGLTEADAFARLRKASQISGRPLKVVAEALIATLGEPGASGGSPATRHR